MQVFCFFFLLHDDEIVVFFASLCQNVLVVEQETAIDGEVGVANFFFIDAHASALGHFAHFAFAGKYCCLVGEELRGRNACGDVVAAHFKLGHAFKDAEQSVFVDFVQNVAGFVAEENLRGFDGCFIVLQAVHHGGDFFGKTFLQWAQAGVLGLLGFEFLNFLLCEVGEDFHVSGCIVVAHVEPKLVELVGRGALGVESHVAALGFAKLGAVGLGDEWAGDGKGFATSHAPDELGACGDVAPLVATAHLQLAVFFLVEVQVVVALQQLIGKFGERHAVVGSGCKAFFH